MLKSIIRKPVLERAHNSCQKCCRAEALAVHHIIAKADDGTDDLDNLITLCAACHEEWHSLETRSTISFDIWLKMPPLDVFIAAFMGEWSNSVTSEQMKKNIEIMHEVKKQERLLQRAIDERRLKQSPTPS